MFVKSHVPDIGWKYTGVLAGMFFFGMAYTMYFLCTVGGGEVLLLGLVGTGIAAGVGAVCNLLYFFPWGAVLRFVLPGVLHGAITLLNYGHGNATDLTFFGSITVVNIAIGGWYFIAFVRSRHRMN